MTNPLKTIHLLIIDDEQEITTLLRTVLLREGFENVHVALTAKEGLSLFQSILPDLVILDIMLPDGSGYDVFKDIQAIKTVPILFISAKDDEVDRLLGFALGAEDYITKPFSPKEVAYRVKARLKSTRRELEISGGERLEPLYRFGAFTLDVEAWEVRQSGEVVEFTAKELKILQLFLQNPNRILSKEAICQAVWGEAFIGFDNTISVHIRKIRLKIEADPSQPEWIQTVIGLGYKFVLKGASR